MGIGNQQAKATGNYGKQLVVDKLDSLGVSAILVPGPANRLTACARNSNRELSLRVKTCRHGPWHIPITEGQRAAGRGSDTDFWVLVDIRNIQRPEFYIIPDPWLRKNIDTQHQAFLLAHGGTRPVTPDSVHHKVTVEDVAQWKDKWALLNLF